MYYKYVKKSKGITIIALVITITVLLIIAGISVYSGKEIIKKAQLESLETNMLLIQAKSREYLEQANFKMGINPDDNKKNDVRQEMYIDQAKLEKDDESIPEKFGIENKTTCYWVSSETLTLWSLDKIELKQGERYLVQFNEENETVEVYNTIGYDGLYSLSKISEIQMEE